MVQTELDQMLNEFEQRLQMQGMNLETYFQFSGQTEEQLKEQMATDAQLRVKTNLVLEAVLEAEHIEVEEADIEAELENIDRKSTRLNSSHVSISYAVFCL